MKKNGIIVRWRGTKKCRPLLYMALAGLWWSCSDDEGGGSTPYDPSLPVTLSSFMPDSGVYNDKFIIKGANFGGDTSIIRVLFCDADNNQNPATLIAANNEDIYGMVPKQADGDNLVRVVVSGDTVTYSSPFHYTVQQNVTTLVGISGTAGSDDGTLSTALIQRTFGIAAVYGGDLLSFEALSGNVRYIAIDDNEVTTIETGFYGAQPAISKDRKKVYCIGKNAGDHKVVLFDYDNLWEPMTLVSNIAESASVIYSCALDDTEKYLYFRDKAGKFGRLEIASPSNVEILNESVGTVGSTDYSYLVYSPVDDCFYVTVQYVNGIYRISKDGQSVENFIGFNGQGTTDGEALECKLMYPGGITVDSKGNLYWCDTNAPLIRKYNHSSGYVSTVAGIAGSFGGDDGEPLESTFSYPYCINADDDDNFFIGESWGVTIRELAIQ